MARFLRQGQEQLPILEKKQQLKGQKKSLKRGFGAFLESFFTEKILEQKI